MLHKDGSSAVFNIALEKEVGKKEEKKVITTRGIRILVTHPSTNPPPPTPNMA